MERIIANQGDNKDGVEQKSGEAMRTYQIPGHKTGHPESIASSTLTKDNANEKLGLNQKQ